MPEINYTTTVNPSPEKGNIKLLSTEVQEIISQRPNWVVRNGMMLFFLIIGSLFATAFFIRYPDVILANAKLTSVNAPKEVKALASGRLIKLLGKEEEYVRENTILGFIESRASHNEVISLSQLTDTLQQVAKINPEGLPRFITMTYNNLGEIQTSYQVFMQALNSFRQYLFSGFYLKKKSMLLGDLSYLQRLHANLEEQKKMQQEDLSLAGQTFDANKSLSEDKVISAFDYRTEKSKYIAKAMTIPQINSSLINNESSRHEKEKEIAQLQNEIAQQKGIFLQALNTLKAQLDDWKSKYLLMAPIAGKVSFTDFLQENTQITQGQTICFINPENTSYYATILIPQANFGKIKKGEHVLLKLPAYPYREFGTLHGKLDFISSIPTDSGFAAKVILPNGLQTDYKKQLQYREGLAAQAEIITEEQTLSDRIFRELRAILKR